MGGTTNQWLWQTTLTKTQQYLKNRITGDGCERDEIEAWRQFYRTHEPVVRLLVAQSGIQANLAECVEEVWLDLIANLNSLRPPQTYDSFLFWLKNSVRRITQQFRAPQSDIASNCTIQPLESSDACQQVPLTSAETLNEFGDSERVRLDDRLLHLRLVEAQPVERVARTLGLTPQQVVARQREILKRILLVLIKLDIAPANP